MNKQQQEQQQSKQQSRPPLLLRYSTAPSCVSNEAYPIERRSRRRGVTISKTSPPAWLLSCVGVLVLLSSSSIGVHGFVPTKTMTRVRTMTTPRMSSASLSVPGKQRQQQGVPFELDLVEELQLQQQPLVPASPAAAASPLDFEVMKEQRQELEEELQAAAQEFQQEEAVTVADPQDHPDSTRSMVKEIASLALPALGGMVLDPVMSLVDTACVGQVCSLQLASLAPCTSICQFIFMACMFLSATTTNLVASAGSSSKSEQEVTEYKERVVSSACILAVVLGSAITAGLIAFADPLLTLAGSSGPGTLMQTYGKQYLGIRALGMPFVLQATVLQGTSLGCQDAWTPLKIFAAAGILNLIGDVVLTLNLGWGVRGAAIATVASQAAASIYYTYRSMRKNNNKSASKKKKNNNSLVRLVYRGAPTRSMIKSFGSVAFTLLLRAIGNMTSYSLMTRKAASLGATALAAHQVTLTLWWLLSYTPEPMSLAAQSLVARDYSQGKTARVPKLVRLLYGMSLSMAGMAALLVGFSLTCPAISSAIVADASVRAMLGQIAPYAMLAQLTCAAGSLTDGVCVGSGNFKHVPASTIGSTALLAVALKCMSSAGGAASGVANIWLLSNLFFVARFFGHWLPNATVRGFLLEKIPKFPWRRRRSAVASAA